MKKVSKAISIVFAAVTGALIALTGLFHHEDRRARKSRGGKHAAPRDHAAGWDDELARFDSPLRALPPWQPAPRPARVRQSMTWGPPPVDPVAEGIPLADADMYLPAFPDEPQSGEPVPMCPEGCGCRLDGEDADRRECGCPGPCTGDDDEEEWGEEYDVPCLPPDPEPPTLAGMPAAAVLSHDRHDAMRQFIRQVDERAADDWDRLVQISQAVSHG